MKPFTYKRATTEAEAVQALGAGALPLAGGTSLLNLMKERVIEPEVLVSLKTIRGLDRVEPAEGGWKIGANAILSDLLENKKLQESYPAFFQALETVGTPQIRNMATLGGNLCARPPCWYFSHEPFACAKRGNANTCPAREGENEYCSIFATDDPCVAVHASSLAPALVALGASVRIAGPGGAREMPLEKFFTLPRENVLKENVLATNEIVTHVTLGPPNPCSATYVVNPKESHDWPIAIASVSFLNVSHTARDPRIVLGAVAPIPWRATKAEAALQGQGFTPEVAEKVADAALAQAAPLSQNAYKVRAAKTAVKRAILLAGTGKWR